MIYVKSMKLHVIWLIKAKNKSHTHLLFFQSLSFMHRYDCLLVVDTVASLGGTPFFMDKWKVDVVYTGSQKVLGAPPGLAPISFNSRAITKVMNRHKKVTVYYWDIMLLSEYWNCFGKPRMYINYIYSFTVLHFA